MVKKTCKNSDDSYNGTENSPLGLGWSPNADPLGTVRIGRNKQTWMIVGSTTNPKVRVWTQIVNKDDSGVIEKEEPIIVKEVDCNSESSTEEDDEEKPAEPKAKPVVEVPAVKPTKKTKKSEDKPAATVADTVVEVPAEPKAKAKSKKVAVVATVVAEPVAEVPVPAPVLKKKPVAAPQEEKAPVMTYIEFGRSVRDQVKKDNPTAPGPEITRIIAQMWKVKKTELGIK